MAGLPFGDGLGDRGGCHHCQPARTPSLVLCHPGIGGDRAGRALTDSLPTIELKFPPLVVVLRLPRPGLGDFCLPSGHRSALRSHPAGGAGRTRGTASVFRNPGFPGFVATANYLLPQTPRSDELRQTIPVARMGAVPERTNGSGGVKSPAGQARLWSLTKAQRREGTRRSTINDQQSVSSLRALCALREEFNQLFKLTGLIISPPYQKPG